MKIFYFIFVSAFLISNNVCAQELSLDMFKTIVKDYQLSQNFINHIAGCEPVEETQNSQGAQSVYKIKGYNEDQDCMIESYTKSKLYGVEVTTICQLPQTELKVWEGAQKNLPHVIDRAKSVEDILQSEEYEIVSNIFLDDGLCISRRSEIDLFRELREHLKSCSSYQQNLAMPQNLEGGSSIMLKIHGPKNNKCYFTFEAVKKAMSKEMAVKIMGQEVYEQVKEYVQKDKVITANCYFSDQSRKEFISLLKKMIIPAGNAFDFDAMLPMQGTSKALGEFLGSNQDCQYNLEI